MTQDGELFPHDPDFDLWYRFWCAAYPHQRPARATAATVWQNLDGQRPSVSDLIAAVLYQKRDLLRCGQFSHYALTPATWLAEKRWLDPTPEAIPASNGPLTPPAPAPVPPACSGSGTWRCLGERPQRDKAARWLTAYLAGGSVLAVEARRLAGQAGHAWRTVLRAKADLRIPSRRQGFGCGACWRWLSPGRDAP